MDRAFGVTYKKSSANPRPSRFTLLRIQLIKFMAFTKIAKE